MTFFEKTLQLFFNLGPNFKIFLIAIFALICGSFASLLSYRLARKEAIIFTRSKCPNCGAILGIKNLIPLFSWLLQAGKCSNCQSKISPRYPLIELSFLVVFLTVFFVFGQEFSWQVFVCLLIAGTLLVMAIIDIEEYFIPDSTQYFLTVLASIFLILQGGTNAVLANIPAAFLYTGFGLALFAFFYFAAKIEAIGVDDIKFFFVIGFLLGSQNFLTFMLLSGALSLVFGTVWQRLRSDTTFPFAPALCLSAFICLLFGQKINLIDLIGSLLFL